MSDADRMFDALRAISLYTRLGGEVAEYGDVVEEVRRLRAAAEAALASLQGYRREFGERQPCDAERALMDAL